MTTRVSFMLITLLGFCGLSCTSHAELAVYPGAAEHLRSPLYTVTVEQGGVAQESFVYVDHNQNKDALHGKMAEANHFSTFSFSGKVRVTVKRVGKPVEQVKLSPRALAPDYELKAGGVSFVLEKPAKLWVAVEGAERNPLFIFADPPETNIPDRQNPNVLWFAAGRIHEVGERCMLKSGQTVYIEGGAYVKGSFYGKNVSNVTVRGRGILSGIDIARKPGVAGIPWNLIQLDGQGDGQLVEGLTLIDPPHFCVLSRGKLAARNLKLFGWWHQTDGWGGGDGSSLEDSFLKVNDDSVKLYGRDQRVSRLVIYQQINGAPFQLGWGGVSQSATNCVVESVDIIHSDAVQKKGEVNQALVSLMSQHPDSVIRNVVLKQVRVESDISNILGFKQVGGRIEGLHLVDWTFQGSILRPSYLRCVDKGRISGLVFSGCGDKQGPRTASRPFEVLLEGAVEAPIYK